MIAEKIEEEIVGAGRLIEDGVVGAHDRVGVAVDDGGAEGGRVGVVEIVERDGNIEAVTKSFGAAVNSVMLGRGNSF